MFQSTWLTKESNLANELDLGGFRIKSLSDIFEYVLSKYQVNKEKYLATLNFSKWEGELTKHSIVNVSDLLQYKINDLNLPVLLKHELLAIQRDYLEGQKQTPLIQMNTNFLRGYFAGASTKEATFEQREPIAEKNVSEEEVIQKLFAAIILGLPFRLTDVQRNYINHIDNFGRTPLHWAAQHSSVPVVQEILRAYPEHLNKGDIDGWTPLFVACLNNNAAVASFLISYGADVDAHEAKFGFTPLFAAIVDSGSVKNEQKSPDCLKLLLANAANPNFEDKYFRSPLWMAAMLGREEFAKELLDNGAVIDCLSESRTPLYIAVQHNRIEVVALLIQYGANIELPDKHGRRPVELAHELELVEMKALLISNGAVFHSKDPRPKLNIALQALIPGKVHHPIVNISEIPENGQFWVFTNAGALYVFSSKTNKLLATCMSLIPFSETFDFVVVVVGTSVWCLSQGRIAVFEWNKNFVNPNAEGNYIEFRGKVGDEKEKNQCVIEKKSWKLDQEVHTIFAVDNNMYGLVTPSSVIVWSLKTYEVVTKIFLFMSIFPKVYECQCRVALGVAPDKSIYISVRTIVYVFEDEKFASHYTLSGEADDIKTMVATSKFVYTTGRFDFMLRIWDLQRRSLVGCMDNAKYDLLFQISQDRFASNHMKTIKIWDKEFRAISEFSTPHVEGIATMLWSSKNKRCWIAGNDNNISVWVMQV